jgi:hypothetical protein
MNINKDAFESAGAVTERKWDGKPITEPGVYAGLPIETYHNDIKLFAGDWSISSSGLRKIIDRPLGWWCESPFNPNREDPETSKALDFGKAAHMLLLGEEGFAQQYALRPDHRVDDLAQPEEERRKWSGNAKDCIAWLKKAEDDGRTVITSDQIKTIRSISDSLTKNDLVRHGILNGRIERSIIAKDGDIWLRSRPDVIPNSGPDYVDLKTAASVDDESLSKAIYQHGYHIQAGFMRMVVRAVLGPDAFQSFTFVFVEKSAPFDVRIKQLKDCDIDIGEKQARHGLKIMRRCIEEGRWPGYDGWGDSAAWVEMPAWGRTRIENELQYGEAA